MSLEEYRYLYDETYNSESEKYSEEDCVLYNYPDNPDSPNSIIVTGVAIVFLMIVSYFL